ncbi:MAG TPA: hypothetical protein VFR15_04915, partial [Chloroflexia bacterium]|nr:hypothetical protein [Chloroflexia bacterium]
MHPWHRPYRGTFVPARPYFMNRRTRESINRIMSVAVILAMLLLPFYGRPIQPGGPASEEQTASAAGLYQGAVNACGLYPIALHASSLQGVPIGGELVDIYNGTQPGNFGWLSWTGATSEPTLATSLFPPGDVDTYVNPNNPVDHTVSVGDWVQGRPGVANSTSIRAALEELKTIDITVPVWDVTVLSGSGTLYHVVSFAIVRITGYDLPGDDRISARYLGAHVCGDVLPTATLTRTPTNTLTPTFTPTATNTPESITSRTYSSNDDFDEGTSSNVEHSVPDQLQIGGVTQAFNFIWVAVSTKGTIVKIDTNTGQVLGEYWTSPQGQPKDPSRTTVDYNGNVWAGNRAGNSVVHVGLRENDGCVDRNGNGTIETSTGLNDIRPWTNLNGADTLGGVSTAQDECIIHYTRVSSSGTRHVSVNADNDVWVSGTGNRRFDLIDGDTGLIIR